jgi:hypothetical protein
MTRRISTAAARKDFASLLRSSTQGDRIKLTRYDKTIAVVVSRKDLTSLEDCETAKRAARRRR